MTDDTKETLRQSDGVTAAAGRMNDKMAAVAAAMEQSSTNANLIAQVSSGFEEVNRNVGETTHEASNINAAIAEVNQSTDQIAGRSNQVNQSAGELSVLAEKLNGMVSRFRL